MRATLLRAGAITLLASLAVLGTPAHAQWKWRDSSGHIQYSDRPPPASVAAKDILEQPQPERVPARAALPASGASAAVALAGAASASGVDPALEARRKQAEAQEAAKRKAEEERVAAVRAQNCQGARDYMRMLDSGQRMARTNDKGEREVFDDAMRAQETEKTRKVIASECR